MSLEKGLTPPLKIGRALGEAYEAICKFPQALVN